MRKNKKDRELGFRDLHEFNIVMFTKQAWRILNNLDSLWFRLLKSIYFSGSDFLKSKSNGYDSWA